MPQIIPAKILFCRSMAKYLGIDFGTTNSSCAVAENSRVSVLKLEDDGTKDVQRSSFMLILSWKWL